VWGAALAALVAGAAVTGCTQKQAATSTSTASANEVAIEVTDAGFVPAVAYVPKGQPVTLVVTRKTDQTCATAMIFTSGEKHELPLQKTVRVELPADHADTLAYACPMDMIKGTIVAR
jgi:plastocyanin domain-containing protein